MKQYKFDAKEIEKEAIKYNDHIFYHYTSIKALYKIISSKSLWLTSLSSANDLKELYYTQNELLKTIDNIISEESSSDYKDFLKEWRKEIRTEDIDISKAKYYALSLTDKRNNLTHWRSYGNSCSGVCLAINIGVFEAYFNLLNNIILQNIIQINHISYTDEEKYEHIKQNLLLVYKFHKENKILDYKYAINLFYSYIIPFIKNNFFFDEQEIRFLFNSFLLDYSSKYSIQQSDQQLLDSFNLSDIKFNDMGDEIRSYKELKLDNVWCKSLFPEIILGPHTYQNLNELRLFLDYYGLTETKIYVSDVPLR